MKKLIGRVLAKESNIGIPNLVVVAYDAANEHPVGKERLPAQPVGKRMASVLTDQEGGFSFTGEELFFNGNEARPDLALAIYAPEDVQSVERPFPLPPDQRILYVSTVPRADAGAEEAFIIRLLQEQLDKYSIPSSGTSRNAQDSVARMLQATSDSLGLRDALKEKAGPRLRREQQRIDKIRKAAADKTKNLSGIPLHHRNGDLRDTRFLIQGRRELAAKLKPAQDSVIVDAQSRLKKHKPSLRLSLATDDLKALGLAYEHGRLTGKVDPKKLAEKTRSVLRGFDLVRREVPSRATIAALQRTYLATSEKADSARERSSHGSSPRTSGRTRG